MDEQTAAKKTRRIGSRTCHCLLIVPLLAVVALASVSLSIFVATEIRLNYKSTNGHEGFCVLYARGDSSPDNSGPRIACDVSIWGEGALVVLGALLAVGMIIKAAAGVRVLNLLLIFELLIIGIGFLAGLAFALNTTIGLSMTCDAYWNHESKSCIDATKNDSNFYVSILESEVAAWLAAAVLLLLFVIYVFLMVAYCYKLTHHRRQYSHLPGRTVQPRYGATKSTNPFD